MCEKTEFLRLDYLMKERMQNIPLNDGGCPKGNRTESERVWGAQTFMWISESSLVTVQELALINRKPPYAEPLVRWCERSVNTKVGDKHLRLVFTSYSIVLSVMVITPQSLGYGFSFSGFHL